MKYDLPLETAAEGTSHALVLDLVGTGHRVLDVGCSTGYLARLMVARGNTVAGVEVDADAAEQARQHLDRLVIGDLERIDLVAEFGAGSFDVLVFADVLEHLRNPDDVLRRCLPLLTEGGSVVMSIPNVAHGAVRLALLEGRFDYQPLGLLDDTHVRFFTRTTLEAMLRTAGLVTVDLRRTTADILGTEIPVDPADHVPETLGRVRADRDAETYQFVLRAVPGGDSGGPLARELLARATELDTYRAAFEQLLRDLGPYHRGPSIAVLSGSQTADPGASLRSAVAIAEARRRLDGVAVTMLSAAGDSVVDWTGEPLRQMQPADVAAVARDVDALVYADHPLDEVADTLIASLAERGVASVAAGAQSVSSGLGFERRPNQGEPGRRSPDPLILVDRLVPANVLAGRVRYLQGTGRLTDADRYVLAIVSHDDPADQSAVRRALDELAAEEGAALVIACGGADAGATKGGAARHEPTVLPGIAPLDALALVAGATVVVTSCAWAAWTGVAFGRPVLGLGGADAELADVADWLGDPDLVAATPAGLLGRRRLSERRASDRSAIARAQGLADLAFDDLRTDVLAVLAPRLPASVTATTALMAERIRGLEAANAALRHQLHRDATALGARAVDLPEGGGGEQTRMARADRRAEEAEGRAAAAEAELTALRNTKSMRLLAPGRRAYARLRGLP